MSTRRLTDEVCAADVMMRRFVSAAPEDTLGELAERLAAADAGSALVVEFGHLSGILTSRDIVRAIADRVHPSEGTVREWMTNAPATASPELPVEEAARLMLNGAFHHLPVVEEERPVGVVGLRTALSSLRRLPGW
jgi:CBS domain-containing protein